MIILAYLVVLILKLKPFGASLAAFYQRIYDHVVVLPQNPRPLLHMLLSSPFILYDIVQIVWVSERPHTNADIGSFAKVRKEKVLMVLHWLKQENLLYEHIVINFNMMQQWGDKFISTSINENVLYYDLGCLEKQGYCTDLNGNNYENDF